MYLLSSVTLCTKYYICRQRNKDYVSNALSRDCRNDASSSTDSWIFNSTFCQNSDSFYYLKLRHYEKATKFEKNLTPVLTKQLFLLSSVKTSGIFFQIFETFSEKMAFTYNIQAQFSAFFENIFSGVKEIKVTIRV